MIRQLVREMLLQEDERIRQGNANLAKAIAGSSYMGPIDRRAMGRTLKHMWQKEADISSFRNVTFIHWQNFTNIANLVRKPLGKDEISAMPYNSAPWKPFTLGWSNVIGAILKGHPTLIANADLNSNAFRKGGISPYDFSPEKIDQRNRSSGWNKYPGPKSPGSEPSFYDVGGELARSWEDHLVYSADEIAPAEKINFDATPLFKHAIDREPDDHVMGWPEALIDNWKVVGLVIPDKLIGEWGIDETLDNLKRHEVPAGIPIYDENGEERSETR